jgi:hypothetical protein
MENLASELGNYGHLRQLGEIQFLTCTLGEDRLYIGSTANATIIPILVLQHDTAPLKFMCLLEPVKEENSFHSLMSTSVPEQDNLQEDGTKRKEAEDARIVLKGDVYLQRRDTEENLTKKLLSPAQSSLEFLIKASSAIKNAVCCSISSNSKLRYYCCPDMRSSRAENQVWGLYSGKWKQGSCPDVGCADETIDAYFLSCASSR